MRRLDALGIPWDVTPGVPAFAAAAPALRRELTLPGVAQTVILTRIRASAHRRCRPARSSPTSRRTARRSCCTSPRRRIEEIAATLIPHYGADCPAAVVARASWPDEVVLRGTLADIAADVRAAGIRRTATILVGPALAAEGFRDSHLYSDARVRPPRP